MKTAHPSLVLMKPLKCPQSEMVNTWITQMGIICKIVWVEVKMSLFKKYIRSSFCCVVERRWLRPEIEGSVVRSVTRFQLFSTLFECLLWTPGWRAKVARLLDPSDSSVFDSQSNPVPSNASPFIPATRASFSTLYWAQVEFFLHEAKNSGSVPKSAK